ncbi:MAG: GNAT family acetyltransferase [Marinomonas sp.]
MKVLPAKASDRDAVIALWHLTDLTRPWNDAGIDFDLASRTSSSTILLAENSGGLVGSVMVGFDGHRGWVYYLATKPEERGKGIGRTLMQEAENWLRQRGAPKIQLMVRADNADVRGFYSSIGYEMQDVITIGRRLD